MAFIVHINGRSMKAVLCKSPDSHGVAFHGWQAEVKLQTGQKVFEAKVAGKRMKILKLVKEMCYAR